MPSEIIYFTVNGCFWGCISTGDIIRSKGKITINRNCIKLDRWNSIQARNIFEKRNNIHKIPVVNHGVLEGDYSRWDDYLFFKRCEKDFSRLIKEYKGRLLLIESVKKQNKEIFIKMRRILEEYNIPFRITNYSQALSADLPDETILFTDTDEMKGMTSIFPQNNFLTYQDFINKMFDKYYNESLVFKALEENGVHCITVNNKIIDSQFCKEYLAKKEKRNKKAKELGLLRTIAYPMMQEEKEFYDELVDKNYVENISSVFISKNEGNWKNLVLQRNGVNSLKDIQSEFINVVNGERFTENQPEDPKQMIYCIGPCIILGMLVGDKYTMESYLQDLCNKHNYKYKVINLGVFDNHRINFSKLSEIPLKKGDIVIIFTYEKDCLEYGIDSINLYQMMEDNNVPDYWSTENVLHINHKINKILANEIFVKISEKSKKICNKSKKVDVNIPRILFLDHYFSDINLEQYNRIGTIVMNCNPFTYGHRYLIEKAYEQVDLLIVFVVEEDKSLYSFEERFAMVREGTKDLKDIYIVPSGDLLLSSTTFPQYFL